jgi:acetyl-CoA C-acetyltransferase
MRSNTVVLATARTPFGRLGGALSSLTATSLGGAAIAAAIDRSGVDPSDVDHVSMGQVLQGGVGQAPARQASFKAGLAKTVTSDTVNKVCASGMLAVVNAARMIDDDDAALVVAGGMESMSNAAYALLQARSGYRFGDGTLFDLMIHDGLWDYFFDATMASQSSKVAAELGLSRELQDEFALRSHQRASEATAKGWLAEEIVSLRVATKPKGKLLVDKLPAAVRARIPVFAGGGGREASIWDHVAPDAMVADPATFSPFVTGDVPHTVVERDEAIRDDASLAAMAKLQPIDRGGSVTAANAPGVSDGACAIVLASESYARSHGHDVLGTIVDHATVAWDPPYLALTPAMAAQKLLDRHGLSASQIDVWEINEAFSAVALSSARRLGLDTEKINAQGGAVALGHPLGASGARIIGSVIHQLRRRGGGQGIAAICSGGGQGDAVLIRVADAR